MQPDWQRDINQVLGKDYNWEPFAKGSSNSLYRGCMNNRINHHLNQVGHRTGEACNSIDGVRDHEFSTIASVMHETDGNLAADLIGDSGSSDQKDCILLRKNAAEVLTPGVDRQREATLLTIISDHHWAPNIIENRPADGWCAMTLYQPVPETHTLTETQQSQFIQAVSQLQQIATNTHLTNQQLTVLNVDYDKLWDTTYLPQAQARRDQRALDWIDEVKQGLRALPEAPLSFVHHDLHMGNLALNPYYHQGTQQTHYQLIILDWEYGGLGNPWLDAAALANFFKLSPLMIATLPAFQHHPPDTFHQGLQQAIDIRNLINKLWYWARGEIHSDEQRANSKGKI